MSEPKKGTPEREAWLEARNEELTKAITALQVEGTRAVLDHRVLVHSGHAFAQWLVRNRRIPVHGGRVACCRCSTEFESRSAYVESPMQHGRGCVVASIVELVHPDDRARLAAMIVP